MKPFYQVEYQVFAVTYFEHKNIISGPDLAEIWRATSIFGNEKGPGDFFRLDRIPDPHKPRMIRLGSMDLIEPLLSKNALPIFGGVSCAQPNGRFQDCDFFFSQSDSGRCFGYKTLPELILGCSGQWFERAGTSLVVELFKKLFSIVDKYCPPYALVDIAPSLDCYSGYAYISEFSHNNLLHRWIEQYSFSFACDNRRDQARGVYWGNYFGPAILNRLGGRDQFLERFRESTQDGTGKSDALIWDFANGVFVSLCRNPLGCKPGSPLDGAAGQNLQWLLLELGSHGVLNPWTNK